MRAALGATECAVPEGASPVSVASQGADVRLRFLSKLLREEGDASKRWSGGWGGLYGLLAVTQLAVMPLFAKEEWPDWYWGAGSSLVGVAFTVLGPLEVQHAGEPFAKSAERASGDEVCRLIAEGERLLREGAEQEAGSARWFMHAGNVLFNAGLGLVLGLGYERWVSAAINFAVGTLIGELTIFTAPNQLVPGLERYLRGGGERPPPLTVRVVPTAGPGLGVFVTF